MPPRTLPRGQRPKPAARVLALRPGRAQEQDRRAAHALHQESEELQRKGIRPVQILQDEDQRLSPRQRLEEVAEGKKGALLDLLGSGVLERRLLLPPQSQRE